MSGDRISAGARVIVVDRDDRFIDLLAMWLESEIAGLRVVARAHSVADAIDQARLHQPDLVIADASLPDGSGAEIARGVVATAPGAAFWVLTLDGFAAAVRVVGPVRRLASEAVTKTLLPAVRALLALRGNGAGKR